MGHHTEEKKSTVVVGRLSMFLNWLMLQWLLYFSTNLKIGLYMKA